MTRRKPTDLSFSTHTDGQASFGLQSCDTPPSPSDKGYLTTVLTYYLLVVPSDPRLSEGRRFTADNRKTRGLISGFELRLCFFLSFSKLFLSRGND